MLGRKQGHWVGVSIVDELGGFGNLADPHQDPSESYDSTYPYKPQVSIPKP